MTSLLRQQLRLLLILALVLAPVQGSFAAQTKSLSGAMTVAADITVQNTALDLSLQMQEKGCIKHGDCSNCQDSVPCGSCPVSLGIPQITTIRTASETQVLAVSALYPLYKTDLSPDYRPPRNA